MQMNVALDFTIVFVFGRVGVGGKKKWPINDDEGVCRMHFIFTPYDIFKYWID